MNDPIQVLIDHIENTEKFYNALKDNLCPNLNRKRQNRASRETLRQILLSFLVKVATDYAAKQGKPNEWKKLFPSHVREAASQILLEHYLKGMFLFDKTRKVFEPIPEPEEEKPQLPENPLELFGDVNKLVGRALNILGDAESKELFEKSIGKLSKIELQLMCDKLELDREGDKETLKQRIIKDFYG